MKLSDDVLTELSAAVIEGQSVRLVRQLDRKAYEAVNKALVACGGKWDRRAKAHIFPVNDPRDVLDAAILTGEVRTAQEDGWFATPPELAVRVVSAARMLSGMSVLEPSAGDGALVNAILNVCPTARVCAIEKDPGRAATLVKANRAQEVYTADFLDWSSAHVARPAFDRVVMNPPFSRSQDVKHVLRAMELVRPRSGRLVAIMAKGITFRQGADYDRLRALIERCGDLAPLPEDAFKSSGTSVRTVLVTLDL